MKTCDLCQRSKRYYQFKAAPLNPHQVASRPFERIHIDHKNLTRKTRSGYTAVLCVLDAFSGWPFLIPVKDMSAETTAQALFKNVIFVFGSFSTLISDRGSAFSAKVFQALITTFGIKHRMSASRQARSNGAAEQLVKRVGELAKRLCETCLLYTSPSPRD